MATPDGIRFHLIKLQADELTRIIEVLKSTRPSNMVELVETVRVLRAELAVASGLVALSSATGPQTTHVALIDPDDADEGVTASPLPRPE